MTRIEDGIGATRGPLTREEVIDECLAVVDRMKRGFMSEEYAYPQPMGSFSERFACDRIREELEKLK